MTTQEQAILDRFKSLVEERVPLHQVILFGSRARGDAHPDSDMDVLVVTERAWDWDTCEFIGLCAWEAGFDESVLVVPVVFSRDEWENGPERSSLLALAVRSEGVPV